MISKPDACLKDGILVEAFVSTVVCGRSWMDSTDSFLAISSK
jgi:hypothetical protein